MLSIKIPQTGMDYWEGTTGIKCECGGMIEWAEAAYVPGARACRNCLTLFSIRGRNENRQLVPQANHNGIVEDAENNEECYLVPQNLYPGWYKPV